MRPAPIPPEEGERLAALKRFEILDTPPEEDYDDVVSLAAYLCGTSMAVVSFVDRDRQWFKARIGVSAEQTPRDLSFCAHAIRDHPDLLIIEDARTDPRFEDHPHVTGPPHIRFYAGVPLETRDGLVLGTLCVLDPERRGLTFAQQEALRALGREVMTLLRLRRANLRLGRATRERDEALERVRLLVDVLGHDLGNHLQAAQLRLELAEHHHPQAAGALQQAVEPLKKARGIIASVLATLRENRQAPEHRLRVRVGAAVYDAAEGISPLAERRGVRVRVHTADVAHAANPLLTRAVENLLSNAVKFAPPGTDVEARLEKDPEGCRIAILDRGPGVPEEVRGRLFERVPRTDAEGTRGYGLGLAIARRIVEAEGGTITYSERPGGGSVFTIRLPVGGARAEAPPA